MMTVNNSILTRQQLKAIFVNGYRPTQEDYAALIDSLALRSDPISASRIEGLPDGLDVEALSQSFSNIHQRLLAIEQTIQNLSDAITSIDDATIDQITSDQQE